MTEPAPADITLDQQIIAATRAYIAARRYGTAEEIVAAYEELQRLLALRDG